MDTSSELPKVRSERGAEEDFAATVLIPALIAIQNQDAGWGFRAGLNSRIEPTSWALLALQQFPNVPTVQGAAERACDFVLNAQLGDGSWPVAMGVRDSSSAAAPGRHEERGAWVTALACWALLRASKSSAGNPLQSVKHGLEWLCNDLPGESEFWWRLRRRIAGKTSLAKQSDSYFGWSWTPGTASWVEPTSQALIALRGAPSGLVPVSAAERIQLAEAMLYDRMCIGGGWNCGNPMVYGVPGEPLVGPTAWALLALEPNANRAQNLASLDWLERTWGEMGSAESMALAHIALNFCGRSGRNRDAVIKQGVENRVEDLSIPVLAWSALALGSKTDWIPAPVA